MSPLGFAWRSLTRQPARACLGILGIAFVGALLLDMLMLSRGLVTSFGELLDEIGYEVRVTASGAFPGAGPAMTDQQDLRRRIEALDETRTVLGLRFADVFVDSDGSVVQLIGTTPGEPPQWTLLEAYEPEPWEGAWVLVDDSFPADRRTVVLQAGVLSGVEARIVGVAEFPFETRTMRTAAVSLETFARVVGDPDTDRADLLLVKAAPGYAPEEVVGAIERAAPEASAFSNQDVLARLQGRDFSYFRQISFVLSVTTIFFAALLVATLLTVSVNQRIAELAALRALGVSRRRIVADLAAESFLIVGIGGVVSVVFGIALARWLDAILKTMPGLPEKLSFFVPTGRAFGLHAALLLLTAALAVLYPVVLTYRLRIADTLRRAFTS